MTIRELTAEETDRRATFNAQREKLAAAHLQPIGQRPATTAQGVHHLALISSDVERTIRFYQEVLGFPLTELFENRDYPGSTHFFFDIGHRNALAYFDLPGLDLGPYAEVLGGHHHLAISMTSDAWEAAVKRLEAAGIASHIEGGRSVYFAGPDGERLELLREPLGEMGGRAVL